MNLGTIKCCKGCCADSVQCISTKGCNLCCSQISDVRRRGELKCVYSVGSKCTNLSGCQGSHVFSSYGCNLCRRQSGKVSAFNRFDLGDCKMIDVCRGKTDNVICCQVLNGRGTQLG